MADVGPREGAQAPSRLPDAFSRILVTGADGFVGGYLVPALARCLPEGAKIVLASRTPDVAGSHASVGLDLRDAAAVESAIASVKPDLVIHLAAQASIGQSLAHAADAWSINFCGSFALARGIADSAPDCTLFYVSSAEVYGQSFNVETVTEESALRPQSPYARSKAAAEAMFGDVLPQSARLIVVRPSNHSGPGQDERFVIPAFATQIARSGAELSEIRVGSLDAERDFMDVRDVVAGYLALLARSEVLPSRATFNIASGNVVRIGSILDRLRRMSGTGAKVVVDPKRQRPSEVPRAAIDASAFRKATGWAPAYSLDATLADVLAEQRTLAGGLPA